MMKRATAHEKNPCCRPEQKRPSLFNEKNLDSRAEESSLPAMSAPLFRCNLMDLPVQPPGQAKSAGPVVQRYVKVGLYEGSLGLDHIGVGVNSEKTKGFSPRAGQSREAERGAWVQGEVREDHDQIESLTIRTSPSQEARLKAALNRSESSSQKFNLSQHNCAQHGAQILKSAGLSVKSSPLPRAFFEGLKRQYASGQREAAGDREPVQGRFESHACPEPGQEAPRPNRTGMPDRLKAGIESLSGIDMSDVRVHANSDRPAKLDALAYTQGSQIYLGPGQERHLAHEAWHAVQQKQGRVRATERLRGIAVNDSAMLEKEAEVVRSSLNDPSGDSLLIRKIQEKKEICFSKGETPIQLHPEEIAGAWISTLDGEKFGTKDEVQAHENFLLTTKKGKKGKRKLADLERRRSTLYGRMTETKDQGPHIVAESYYGRTLSKYDKMTINEAKSWFSLLVNNDRDWVNYREVVEHELDELDEPDKEAIKSDKLKIYDDVLADVRDHIDYLTKHLIALKDPDDKLLKELTDGRALYDRIYRLCGLHPAETYKNIFGGATKEEMAGKGESYAMDVDTMTDTNWTEDPTLKKKETKEMVKHRISVKKIFAGSQANRRKEEQKRRREEKFKKGRKT